MKNSMKACLVAASLLVASQGSVADIVVVVHPEHPLASVTKEQLADIYLGRDTRFTPIDLPESERRRHWFYFKVTGRDLVQIKAWWARRFAYASPPKVAADSAEAVRLVASNKRAIAYVDRSAVDASVKEIMSVEESAALRGAATASDAD